MKILRIFLLTLLLLPVVLVALIILVANTQPGQRFIETESNNLTGGKVILSGVSGHFPELMQIAHAELRDTKGAWLTTDDLTIELSPLALITRTARIDLLQVQNITILRLPQPNPPASPAQPSQGGFSLPVTIDLRALHIATLHLAPAVARTPATLRIDGAANITSPQQSKLSITADRIDSPGIYRLVGAISQTGAAAQLLADEPQNGLISNLGNLPAIGALHITAAIEGPQNAEKIDLRFTAGKILATANGSVDLERKSAALDVNATAPAMSPRSDLSWGGINLQMHFIGPFKTPEFSAHALLQNLKAGGTTIATITADATGNHGTLDAHSVVSGLIIPGSNPDLFTTSPFDFTLHADLDQPTIPIRFALKNALITADGTATAGGGITATLHTAIRNIAPLAALGHADIQGSTEATASIIRHGEATDLTLDGTADFNGGETPVAAVLGKTSYGASVLLAGQNISISRAAIDGKRFHAALTGDGTRTGLDLTWKIALTDLAALAPQTKGSLQAKGNLQSSPAGWQGNAEIKGDIGTASIPNGPITVSLTAQDLSSALSGSLNATGSLDNGPIELNATLNQKSEGNFQAVLKRATWKSFTADANMLLAKGARTPAGIFTARMTHLADLAPVIHQNIAGGFTAKIVTGDRAQDAKIDAQASSIVLGNTTITRLSLTGNVHAPAGKTPDLALALAADGINAPNISGSANLRANGKLNALMIHLTANTQTSGSPAMLTAGALLDMPGNQVTLQNFAATYKSETAHLIAPSHLSYGVTKTLDRLRVAIGTATLDAGGKIAPTLDLTASLHNVTPNIAKAFYSGLNAVGLLSADAHLTGTIASPQGTVRLQANNLRLRTGPAAALPPGSILATAALNGDTAQISARANAGPKLHLKITGTAPIEPSAALGLHTSGDFDLSLLDPVLNASGRRAAGMLALDATLNGTLTAPQIAGSVTLAHGEIQDFVRGLHITGITANITAAGDTVKIQEFTGKAAQGTLSLTGSVGVFAPGVPVDLHFLADGASPLASDLITANMNADISVQGHAKGDMHVSGKIFVRKAEINIPDRLPPSVAVLNVRYPGYQPPPPAPTLPPSAIHLSLVIDAPSNIFVRGHGLDSELGGKLTIDGMSSNPQMLGGFTMRRGDINVAGTLLSFSKGEVTFDGSSVTGKIDPTLNFVADSSSGGVTATLTVGGYADAPKITLSSVPSLPQDEVLAHLLFGASVKDLSTVQIAEISAALAELSGVTGGIDPLSAIRKGLALDRLSVGGNSTSGATVEAGRYVSRGVYVGAKQNTGGGTAAIVQIDLARQLKLTSQLATGGGSVQGATPDNDPGSTIGLSYGFDY